KVLQECLTQLALGPGTILRGGIAKAVEHLGAHRSPNVLIVDISGVDLPISQVHSLADVCEPGVAVVAIGNRNEIGLYLDLQNGDCALALDIKPNPGLREALSNPLRIDNTLLERVLAPVGERLFVLSSEEPLSVDLHFTAVAVETLVAALREQFHYVILDVPRIPLAPYRRA